MKPIRHLFALAALAGLSSLLVTGPAVAAGKSCSLEISGNDMMQFDKKELAVAADCTEVVLTLKHIGKLPASAMGHNWVLVKTPDMSAVSTAGMASGAANNYLPKGDKRILAGTKVVGGGESTSVTFATAQLKKGESYSYLCTFPGHSALMKGILKFG